MTLRQARALAALMLGVNEHDVLPTAADIEDGCYTRGTKGATSQGIAELMNLWQLLRHANAQSASRCLNALVEQGLAARVFIPSFQAPRFVPTQAGREMYQRLLSQANTVNRI